MSALESAVSAPWAMLPERVEELLDIAAREHEWTPETLEAYRSAHAERGERMRVRDGIAILDVSGPLFKRANLFVAFSGATSYEILRRDLQVALDDPAISGVMLAIDSPGGEANGCDELATAIYEARGKKPIHAYVSGMACSGGYWLASAAQRVVVSENAILGSIGVVLGVTDRRKADERNGVTRVEFVSSMSPGKRPDVATDDGKARIQKMVDRLGQGFVEAVARNRGVKAATVIKEFGNGGVEIGPDAVAAGMADEVGQFEAALAALSKSGTNRRVNPRSNGVIFMSNANNAAVETNQVDVAKIQSEAAAKAASETQARIKTIMTSEEGKAMPTLASHYAYDTNVGADVAIAAMKAAKADFDAAASKEPKPDAQSFQQRKEQAGTLGLASPEARDAGGENVAAAGWKTAADRANARFGKDGV